MAQQYDYTFQINGIECQPYDQSHFQVTREEFQLLYHNILSSCSDFSTTIKHGNVFSPKLHASATCPVVNGFAVLDLAISNGKIYVLEMGCINAAGLYHCDIQKIVMALEILNG